MVPRNRPSTSSPAVVKGCAIPAKDRFNGGSMCYCIQQQYSIQIIRLPHRQNETHYYVDHTEQESSLNHLGIRSMNRSSGRDVKRREANSQMIYDTTDLSRPAPVVVDTSPCCASSAVDRPLYGCGGALKCVGNQATRRLSQIGEPAATPPPLPLLPHGNQARD